MICVAQRALAHEPSANRGGGRDLCPFARRMGVLSCSAAGAAGRSRAGGAPDALGAMKVRFLTDSPG